MMNRLLSANTMDEVMQIVEQEVEFTKQRISTRIKRIFKDRNQTSAHNMKLMFRSRISRIILTGNEIKGEGNTPIEVVLVDDPMGNIIDVGPEASASVEIVLLKGETDPSEGDDWTAEEFNENIIPEVEGKQPLLAENVPLKLQRGVGVVEKIKFRHHASKIKPSVFRLGARVIGASDGSHIKGAKTESFTVKDFRYKYHEKHVIPSLTDEVPRLVYIRKGGKIDKCLQDNKIYTVEDFLIRLLIDPEELRSIVNLGKKKWEATVKNARACVSDSRMYCYIKLEQKMGVVFNVLGQVLGLYIESQYSQTSMLSEKLKAYAQELLASAYKNWGDVKAFDDVSSLQQHFAGLSTCMDPADSFKPDQCPGGRHENTGMSEVIGESSSRRSNMSFHSVNSTMNSFRDTGVEDFCSFSTDDMDIENMYNAVMHSPSNFDIMFAGFDEFIPQKDSCSRLLNGLINESNTEQQSAATDITFAESQDVETSNPPNRWKKLLSRWFYVKKRVSLDATRNRKKQKVL